MSYPDMIPFNEIKTVLEIMKSGNIKQNAANLAYNAWIIQGYAQKVAFGDPNMLLMQTQSAADPLAILEQIVASEGQLEAQLSVQWDVVLKYAIQIVVLALQAMSSVV
jgi:hypothetical protein